MPLIADIDTRSEFIKILSKFINTRSELIKIFIKIYQYPIRIYQNFIKIYLFLDQFTQIQSTWIDLQSSIDAQLLNDVTALEEKTINEIELLHNKSQENNSDIMSTDLAAAQIRFLAQMTATLKNNLMSVEKEIAEFHERSGSTLML